MSTPTAHLMDAVLADLGLDSIPAKMPLRGSGMGDDQGGAAKFAAEYLAYNLVRKLEPFEDKKDVPTAVLRASLMAFAEAEWNCTVMNRHGRFYSVVCEEEKALFLEASRLAELWISRTLMDYWPRWEDQDYTSGASRNMPRSESLRVMKENGGALNRKMSVTSSALEYVAMKSRPGHTKGVEIVDDSVFDFVQKTARAVRFMALEPEENMPAQRALGDCIRAALLEQGINLNSQLLNQQMAYLASVFRTRATIDLTSASDCVAIACLRYLPVRFREWVLDLRTPKTSVRGSQSQHVLQKVATMGNGFIFELQSLLYAAWAHGITAVYGGRECDIAVYGDDIVVSTQCAQPLIRFLEWHGFIVNTEKSYFTEDEPFRESCGVHYYAGHDVTPFYIKEPLGTLPTIFRCYNGLRYWSLRTGIRLPLAEKYLVSLLDKKDRVVVPTSWSITSGLHFPVSGCTFPRKRYCSRLQKLVRRQRCLVPPVDDVTERVCDHYRLQWWLYEPPRELIDKSYYPHLSGPGIARSFNLEGYPREGQLITRGTSTATSEWSWVDREIDPGDTA